MPQAPPERDADAEDGIWQNILESRGYALGLHQVLLAADPEFMGRFEQWERFVYSNDRYLDRRIREFIVIGILAALRSPPEYIKVHLNAAIAAGASKEELIVIAELVGQGGGAIARAVAVEAWRLVFAPQLPAVFEVVAERTPPTSAGTGTEPTDQDKQPSKPGVASEDAQSSVLDTQKREMSERVMKARGFGFGLHAVLAEADWEFMQKLQEWVEFVYLSERYLDRRIRELVIIGVLGALRSSPHHIAAHINAGVKAGVTKEEVIVVAELLGSFSGSDGLISVVEAWRMVFAPQLQGSLQPQEHK